MIKKERDINILKFIEQNKGISISQCAKIFYHGHKFAYDEARRRLKILEYNKYITHFIMPNTSEYVYYTCNEKTSYHNFMIFNVYAELVYLNFNILLFQKELLFSTNKRCDAYFELEYNNQFIPLFIEIDFTHKTNISKYDDVYLTHEIQNNYINRFGQEYDSIFPRIIIVSYHYKTQYNYKGLLDYDIVDFDLKDLFNIIMFNSSENKLEQIESFM